MWMIVASASGIIRSSSLCNRRESVLVITVHLLATYSFTTGHFPISPTALPQVPRSIKAV